MAARSTKLRQQRRGGGGAEKLETQIEKVATLQSICYVAIQLDILQYGIVVHCVVDGETKAD